MSHIVKAKVDAIASEKILQAALKRISGLTVKQNAKIKYYAGSRSRETFDYVVQANGAYDIGLRKNKKGQYEVFYDSYGSQGQKSAKIARQLVQYANVEAIKEKGIKKGYTFTEQQQEDGSIKVILRRY